MLAPLRDRIEAATHSSSRTWCACSSSMAPRAVNAAPIGSPHAGLALPKSTSSIERALDIPRRCTRPMSPRLSLTRRYAPQLGAITATTEAARHSCILQKGMGLFGD